MSHDPLPPLILQPRADRRLRGGHCWVYSNEVDTRRTPLGDFEPGDPVDIISATGRWLGNGYVNPHTLICARLISRDPRHRLSRSLLVHRLQVALALRQRFFPQPCYRLVYGDGDSLPGLVVDRYGDILVVQIGTAGMERQREAILQALEQVVAPRAILLRNDSRARATEQLPTAVECVLGEVPELAELEENGVRFLAPLASGQKTGWFYDHRAARARIGPYVRGRQVLDVFSYVGGWGVQAACQGATRVLCLDSSAMALDVARQNAELNGVADRLGTLEGSAFEQLAALADSGERFDTVILDPPALIPRRRDRKAGEQAYRRLNQLALRLLRAEGHLISASCSLHLQRETLVDVLRGAARHVDRHLQILEQCGLGADHPVHPAIPETDYLKSVFTRVLHHP